MQGNEFIGLPEWKKFITEMDSDGLPKWKKTLQLKTDLMDCQNEKKLYNWKWICWIAKTMKICNEMDSDGLPNWNMNALENGFDNLPKWWRCKKESEPSGSMDWINPWCLLKSHFEWVIFLDLELIHETDVSSDALHC